MLNVQGLTSLCDVELHGGGDAVAGAAGVVALVPLAGVAKGQLALCGLAGGGVGVHLNPPLHVVVDHPVVVIPEDVLGRAGGGVQHAGEGDGGALVHVILLAPLDVRLGEHHVELHPPGDGSGAGGHLALVDAPVTVLHELDLEWVRVRITVGMTPLLTWRTQLNDPSL